MAFFAMILATGFLIIVVLGLIVLLAGIILDVVWIVRKKKEKKFPLALKIFAIVLTVIGVVQGIGPIVGVGLLQLKSKMEYRAEISDLPEDSILHLKDYSDLGAEFDYKGVHYIGVHQKEGHIINPWKDNDNFKTTRVGAIVFDNDKHYIIEKIENDLDEDIYMIGLIYDPYVAEEDYNKLTEYYKNEAPLSCKYSKESAAEMKTVYSIDSDRVRAIRDYVESQGPTSYGSVTTTSDTKYLYFYSNDSVYNFDFSCAETPDGLLVESWGNSAVITGQDADYLRSLMK